MKVGPWIIKDGGASRSLLGYDIDNIARRIAFIEKTPRVRIRDAYINAPHPDWLNWASGPKGNGPEDLESQKWCDDALVLFGYELS